MLSLGPLTFAAPWALAALVALPLLWMLLRATPPAPRTVVFAPIRLLQRLARTPETPQSTPWWLVLLTAAAGGDDHSGVGPTGLAAGRRLRLHPSASGHRR
jgi:hypothetical protein